MAVGEGAALHVPGSLRGADGTGPAAPRAGLLRAQQLGLLSRGLFEGAGGAAAGGGLGDEFPLGQIDVAAGSLVAEGLADDAFAPVLGPSGNAVESVGGERS